VASVPGPQGGFSLARPAEEVTLLEVYEAVDGPLQPTRCLIGLPVCKGHRCILGGFTREMYKKLAACLRQTRLADVRNSLRLPADSAPARPRTSLRKGGAGSAPERPAAASRPGVRRRAQG